jgi:DNA-binding transcriptional LysR family regulator
MTLEQLRIFVAVAERQHITRAAEALNLSQSAVSAAVTALEARHGVTLLDRVGRGVALNGAGAVFLAEAKAVLARADEAQSALEDLSNLDRGRLSIHASQTIASYWLPQRLAAFHLAHPGIALAVAIGNTAQVAAAVAAGEAELGLVEGAVDDPALSREVVAQDRLCLVVGRSHPWADRPPSSPDDLKAAGWVLREPGSGTRAVLETALPALGLMITDLPIAMVLPANEAVRAAVEAGAGAAVMSSTVAAAGLEAGRLIEVEMALPPRDFTVLRHKQRYRTRAADAFSAMISINR